MKKNRFALLIFLVLCLTIAGAYATWSYVEGQNIADLDKSISVNLADKNVTTASGGTIKATGSVTATIDDIGSYKAGLVLAGDGFTVSYDATGSATPTVTEIQMKATVTVASIDYNEETVVTAKTTNVIYSETAVSEWTITPAMIANCLEIADITLPTSASYDAFKAALDAGSIVITVTISAV